MIQIFASYNNSSMVTNFIYLGFICYPIVILCLDSMYCNLSLHEKNKFLKNISIYCISLLLLNTLLLLVFNKFSLTQLIDSNLFLSFLVFLTLKKLVNLSQTKRLSLKCNIYFLILLIATLYIPIGDNLLYILLFLIFYKLKNKTLVRNISLLIAGIIVPILTTNIYLMGCVLSLIFIHELNTDNTNTKLRYDNYNKVLFICILLLNIIKIVI